MSRYALLYLENQPMVAKQIASDLACFASKFDIHSARTIEDAEHALSSMKLQGQTLALVIASHEQALNGARFLTHLDKQSHTQQARKILISDANDIHTILSVVNDGRLDHCLTKPLQSNQLHDIVLKELTTFILACKEADLLRYSSILDQPKIMRGHIERQLHDYRVGFIHDFHKLSDVDLAQQVINALRQFFSQQDDSHACRTYSTDHLLTKEGEPNRFLWFITRGEVSLYKKDDMGVQREVVRHKKGNIVGGMSFVTGEDSFSTAITLTQTEVIKLDKDIFAQVMHTNDRLLPLFTNLLLRHFNRRLQRSIDTKIILQKTLESLELAHQQLIEREKMAMLGQLVAGVAHELNNPIAAILRGAETLTQTLNELMQQPISTDNQQQAIKLMQHALCSHPMSTSQIRSETKSLTSLTNDRLAAKKIVQFGLHQNEPFIQQLKKNKKLALANINEFEKCYLAGTTLRSINVCAQRIADMVRSLKGYARPDDESLQVVDIHEGIEDTLVIFENRLKRHNLTKEYQPLPEIQCQPVVLQQVWTNLISNALDALPSQGQLLVKTELSNINNREYIVISIRDDGCGMSEDVIEKIFELNYTTKKEGHFGLGIGLSVCQQIINSHNGWIKAESKPGLYTLMQVGLPTGKHIEPATLR
ncbi:ATPase [Vibrio sp. 10N.286.49.B3]|uniref:ATP-binding protein n=1 Tax=Vibrio sp. 10N.286.49.B3 TaxID=1880855 RepID=UPI000C83ABA1|nr:ATP-binding protein [Vibrio sp. 10N.286.49.B3]PMH46653.1 ATPase [Vibrio sp. 10N.286.49.B3]